MMSLLTWVRIQQDLGRTKSESHRQVLILPGVLDFSQKSEGNQSYQATVIEKKSLKSWPEHVLLGTQEKKGKVLFRRVTKHSPP